MTEYIITLQYSSSISKFETSVRLLNEENKKIEFLTDHAAKDPFNKLFPLRLDQSLPSRGKCRTDPAVHRKNANQMSKTILLDRRSLLDHHLQKDTSRYNLYWETEMQCSGIPTQAYMDEKYTHSK